MEQLVSKRWLRTRTSRETLSETDLVDLLAGLADRAASGRFGVRVDEALDRVSQRRHESARLARGRGSRERAARGRQGRQRRVLLLTWCLGSSDTTTFRRGTDEARRRRGCGCIRVRRRDGAVRPAVVIDDPDALERLLEPLRLEFAPLEFFERRALRLEQFARGSVLQVFRMPVLEEAFDDVAELGVLLQRLGKVLLPCAELQFGPILRLDSGKRLRGRRQVTLTIALVSV
jgi:hypothetical protein